MDPFDELLFLMGDVADRIQAFHKKPRDFGTGDLLHRAEIHTVQCIGDFPGQTVTATAQRMKVTKGAISQIVRKLEDKSLVERYQDPDNNRDVKLRLTRQGAKARKGHEQIHDDLRKQMQDYLGEAFDKKIHRFIKVFSELDTILDHCEPPTRVR